MYFFHAAAMTINYVLFIVMLYGWFLCVLSKEKGRVHANAKKYSVPFELKMLNFECLSVECPAASMHDFWYHIVVGTDHKSSVELLVNRICEAHQKCIKKENIKLLLHQNVKDSKSVGDSPGFTEAVNVLHDIGISFASWNGVFTADRKMLQSYEIFNNYTDANSYIYHTDIDEIPEPESFGKALLELKSGQCDGIRAQWVDRLSSTGALNSIRLEGSLTLSQQFPLRCNISPLFVGSRTEKIIAYRASYRLDSGQHEIWCAPLGDTMKRIEKGRHGRGMADVNKPSYMPVNGSFEYRLSRGRSNLQECIKHIESRKKTDNWHRIITKLPPANTARYCPTVVKLDHFKFIEGLESYLKKRVDTYRLRGLNWWTDSWRFLAHMDNFNSTICTDCDKSRCFDTTTGVDVPPVFDKRFTCTKSRTNSCVNGDGIALKDIFRNQKKRRKKTKSKSSVVTTNRNAK